MRKHHVRARRALARSIIVSRSLHTHYVHIHVHIRYIDRAIERVVGRLRNVGYEAHARGPDMRALVYATHYAHA